MSDEDKKLIVDLIKRLDRLEKKIDMMTKPGKLRSNLWNAVDMMNYLGVSKNTLYKIALEIGGVKTGRVWKFKPEMINLYLFNNLRGGES